MSACGCPTWDSDHLTEALLGVDSHPCGEPAAWQVEGARLTDGPPMLSCESDIDVVLRRAFAQWGDPLIVMTVPS